MENIINLLFIYLMQANLNLKNKCTFSLFLVSIFLNLLIIILVNFGCVTCFENHYKYLRSPYGMHPRVLTCINYFVLCFNFYFEAKMNLKWVYIELDCAVDEMSELLSSETCFSF